MCGINIIASLNKEIKLMDIDKNNIINMNKQIKYRGPDNSGCYFLDNIMLGHNRLTIVDKSSKANQPLVASSQNIIIVFNGEIYNFQELRKKCSNAGYKFRTYSDTEVIVSLYEIWGIKGLDMLEGMFVFAIYNKFKKEMIIRRDRYGIKPFYFTILENKFYGSSELIPLIKIQKNRDINFKAVSSIFLFDNNCFEESLIKGIYKLPPGDQIFYSSYSINKSKWFYLNSLVSEKHKGPNKFIDDLEINLSESIKRQANTEVPTCIFYSGGLDSSLVTHYSMKTNQNIKLFSFLPESITSSNKDVLNAYERAKLLGANKFEYLHFENKSVVQYLDNFLSNLYEPTADAAIIPTLFMSEIAKSQGFKVVLTGDGADELFGGYQRYQLISNFFILNFFSQLFKKPLKNLIKNYEINSKFKRLINSFTSIDCPEVLYSQLLSLEDTLHTNNNGILQIKDTTKSEIISQHFSYLPEIEDLNSFSLFDAISRADLSNLLSNQYLPKIDNTTMLFSLEARVPFLDDKLVRFVLNSRKSLSLPIKKSKPSLRKLSKNIFPKSFSKIPKQGYGIPIKEWLSDPLYDYLNSVDIVGLKNYGIDINIDKFKKEAFNIRKRNNKISSKNINALWKIIIMSKWINNLKKI